jgi:uncharacterized protein YegL
MTLRLTGRHRVELDNAAITLGAVEFAPDFISADASEPPTLVARGNSRLGRAVVRGLDLIEKRKAVYRRLEVSFYPPMLWGITAGIATDDPTAAVLRATEADTHRRASIWAAGAGHSFDADCLAQLSLSRAPLRLREVRFDCVLRPRSVRTGHRRRAQTASVLLPDTRAWAGCGGGLP